MFKRNIILVLLAYLFALAIAVPTKEPSINLNVSPAVLKQKIAEADAAFKQVGNKTADIGTQATWWGQICPCRSQRYCYNPRTFRYYWEPPQPRCNQRQFFSWGSCRKCICTPGNTALCKSYAL